MVFVGIWNAMELKIMNDFTKEELEDILSWGDVYNEFGQSFAYELNKPLLDKIQSMIDNYCEHEWKHRYDVSEYDECLKCGSCEL